jgi:DNA-binding NtrC family response regulator
LTAVRSPFADGETRSVPVIFVAGNAKLAPGPNAEARRWWILPSVAAAQPGDEIAWIGRASGTPADADAESEGVAILLADPLVSGRHARLVRDGDSLAIEDLGSKNGTFIDGQRVIARASSTRTAWPDGGVAFVGDHALIYRLVSPHALVALEEEATAPLAPVATASPALASMAQKLRRWAAGGQELLLCGETGVGKEVYARAVHATSGRSGAFVALNCAALPRELVESELFGYRAGAHSTARGDKPGLIERAQAGTLFLDEIGELPQEGQAKLLRFLQDRELTPLGGQKPRRIEVSIVAATNQEVDMGGVLPAPPAGARSTGDAHAADGKRDAQPHQALRADLVGRLGAAPVLLPPLRDRREDIGALCRHFLAALLPGRTPLPGFEGPAFRALFLYAFPLNVRELEKVLGAAVALTEGRRPIALGDLPPAFAAVAAAPPAARSSDATSPWSGHASSASAAITSLVPSAAPSAASGATPAPAPSSISSTAVERTATRRAPAPGPTAAELEALLARHGGNVAEVSRTLGRQRAAVWRWIKRFGLGVQQHRSGSDPEAPDDAAAGDDDKPGK